MKPDLSTLFNSALTHITDAKAGLPQEAFYFISQLTPLINVDLLIKNKTGQTMLTWRADAFYGPAWHIPGGIIRFKEKIEDRIHKVAQSELGCEVKFAIDPIKVVSLVNHERDIRGHFISLLFLCELKSLPDPAKKYQCGPAKPGEWAWHTGTPSNFLRVQEPFRKYIDDGIDFLI